MTDEVNRTEETERPVPVRRLRLDEMTPGMVLPGKIKNITKFGAFVDIGAEQDGLVHISALSDDYVKRVEDVVKVGDDVNVTVLEVDRNRKRVSLSMKSQPQVEEVVETVEPDEQVPSAMELAMREALEGGSRQERHKDRRKKERVEQEDILSRTLKQHREKQK